MADPVLSVIAELVLKNLGHLMIQETRLLCGCNQEEELRDTVSAITVTLKAVENGEFIITEPVKDWLRKLKEVLYDADDVLDDFRTEALRWKLQDNITKKVRSFFSRSNLFVYNLKMGHKIKHIRERLDNIEKVRSQFKPRATHNPARLVDTVQKPRETDSSLPSGIFGRDKDKEKIVKLLMDCGSEDISVVPIIGLGGVGKTTLAQMVFNDDRIKGHFELCIWVCVSTDFDKKKITEKIVASVTREKCAGQQMETLRCLLGDKLDGKRYLIVLDNVWNEDPRKWTELKDLLMMSSGKKAGSKILMTTRSKVVAKVMCPTLKSYDDLSFLPTDDSWYVFKQCALIAGQETPALEKIGKEIVGKCGGLPLALNALGSLLYGNVNEDDWKYVRDNEMWRDLTGKELDVLPIIKFSYDNLPSSQVKQCFAYCSLFPKDADLPKGMLIHLWMAQGFLHSSDPRRLMEDIGNHYFNVLLSRSFFQDVEKDDDGNIKTCKVHDLMHDLAQLVSGGECLIVDEIDTPIPACVRHMWLSCDTFQVLSAPHKLRTFLTIEEVEVSHDAWSSFRYVRVLTLTSITQEQLCSISELKHLRFLGISSDDSIKELPESIIMLQNLQTLCVLECGLEKLPKDIGKIESLRHLYIINNDEIKTLPESICKLTNLQSLTLKGCSGIEELPVNIGEMISLRHLNAKGLGKIKRLPESIGKLTNLKSLVLKECDELEALPEEISEMVSLGQLKVYWNNESTPVPYGLSIS